MRRRLSDWRARAGKKKTIYSNSNSTHMIQPAMHHSCEPVSLSVDAVARRRPHTHATKTTSCCQNLPPKCVFVHKRRRSIVLSHHSRANHLREMGGLKDRRGRSVPITHHPPIITHPPTHQSFDEMRRLFSFCVDHRSLSFITASVFRYRLSSLNQPTE